MKKRITENDIRKMVAESLKKVFNESDDEYFNPEWEDSVDDILAKYKNNDEEFDDTAIGDKYKIDKNNPFFYDKKGQMLDADAIGDFHNDFAIVKKGGKCNYVDEDGKLLSDEWFDACNDFEDGFGMVRKETKRNYVRSNGELLLDMWVDRAGDFIGGTAPVIINGERHEVDRTGNIR